MARPIPFDAPPRDPRMELQHRLEHAPADHAEALLDAYDLLQKLHDRGMLDTMRGLVGSSETVLDIAVQGARAPESIHALRNLLLMFNMLGTINPETMKKFVQPMPLAMQVSSLQTEAPGLLGLMKMSIWNKDFRRGLAAMIGILRGVGMGLANDEEHPGKAGS